MSSMGAFNSNKRNNNDDGNDDKSIDFILRAHNVRSIYEISSRFETTAKWYRKKKTVFVFIFTSHSASNSKYS